MLCRMSAITHVAYMDEPAWVDPTPAIIELPAKFSLTTITVDDKV